MRIPPLRLLLLAGLLAGLPLGCSKRDSASEGTGIAVEEDDPEMAEAIAKARASLPDFWNSFENQQHGESDFALKVRIADENGTEHFWATEIERENGKIYGTIDNDPEIVKTVKPGDRVPIAEADISDWLYLRGGKMVGNQTLRALFKTMPADEVRQHKRMLADP